MSTLALMVAGTALCCALALTRGRPKPDVKVNICDMQKVCKIIDSVKGDAARIKIRDYYKVRLQCAGYDRNTVGVLWRVCNEGLSDARRWRNGRPPTPQPPPPRMSTGRAI